MSDAALVNLHSAAGVGHAMGNIFTAYRNRTPLVITAGQQARSILPYEPFLFATQATKLPEPYVKWTNEPARGEDVPGHHFSPPPESTQTSGRLRYCSA